MPDGSQAATLSAAARVADLFGKIAQVAISPHETDRADVVVLKVERIATGARDLQGNPMLLPRGG
jgi:hypothetical protein